jgi:GDP-L-fucose synthase
MSGAGTTVLPGRKVFVAGGAGLAGSAILRELEHSGDFPSLRASYHTMEPFLYRDKVEYVRGDLTSQEDCRRMMSGCDSVVMAAARTGGAAELVQRPWVQINQNLAMNAAVLQAAAETRVRRLVVVSTASLYQPFEGAIREEQLDLNIDPPVAYAGIGWVARYVEKLCGFWRSRSSMSICIMRTSNIFGPYARFNPQSSNFIPALIRKAVDRMDPFEVWGNPGVTRDVVFSYDFARAVVMLLKREDLPWGIFNIGSGVYTTVGSVVEWSLKAAGHTPSKVTYNKKGPTTIQFRALDCSKAKQVIGWTPSYTIEEGIRETLKWWERNRGTWTR